MVKIRKLPGELEAYQFLAHSPNELPPQWFLDAVNEGIIVTNKNRADVPYLLIIDDAQGNMTVKDTDWVIKGVEGNLYPTTNSIFEKTYEVVDANAT